MFLNSSKLLILSYLLLVVSKQSQTSVEVTITPINEDVRAVDQADLLPGDSESLYTYLTPMGAADQNPPQVINEANKTDSIPSGICNSLEKYSVLMPDLTNCSNYYQVCTKSSRLSHAVFMSLNLSNAQSCPLGTSFDSLDGQCVKKENAFCGLYNCAEPNSLFPDPMSRNNFIFCIDGVPQRKSCTPKGTIFMNVSKACAWAPGELSWTLKLFKAAIWFIKYTESSPLLNDTNHDHIFSFSTEWYLKVGILATIVPLIYIFTIVYLYIQCNGRAKNRKLSRSSFTSDLNEHAHRYYSRPTRSSGSSNIQLHPLTFQPRITNNPVRDSYFVTSHF